MKISEIQIGVEYVCRGGVGKVVFDSLQRYEKITRGWSHEFRPNPKGMYLLNVYGITEAAKAEGYHVHHRDYVHIPQLLSTWEKKQQEMREQAEINARRWAASRERSEKIKELAQLMTAVSGKWVSEYAPLESVNSIEIVLDALRELQELRAKQ